MRRTQIQLTEEQMEALRREAARRSLSVSEILRQAVDAWLKGLRPPTAEERRRRALEIAGRFGSGKNHVSASHDEHLSDIYRS